jgi:hypothetical protein
VKLKPMFVEFMPSKLDSGVLYISVAYSVTTHLCACGCGEKVVLPLHPKQWRLTYDGVAVSMFPSVGNVGMACMSHYWIEEGRIDWARSITDEQARRGRERDRRELAVHERPAQERQETMPRATRSFFARLVRRR